RLIASSNFVGSSIGRSLGFSPLRIRATSTLPDRAALKETGLNRTQQESEFGIRTRGDRAPNFSWTTLADIYGATLMRGVSPPSCDWSISFVAVDIHVRSPRSGSVYSVYFPYKRSRWPTELS